MGIKKIKFDNGTIGIDHEDNRIHIKFLSDIPESKISELMLSGFCWSTKEAAWVSKMFPKSVSTARKICNLKKEREKHGIHS